MLLVIKTLFNVFNLYKKEMKIDPRGEKQFEPQEVKSMFKKKC